MKQGFMIYKFEVDQKSAIATKWYHSLLSCFCSCMLIDLQCMWLGERMKEEQELVLYPNKNGTVADLLHEARKQVTLSENGSGKLR